MPAKLKRAAFVLLVALILGTGVHLLDRVAAGVTAAPEEINVPSGD